MNDNDEMQSDSTFGATISTGTWTGRESHQRSILPSSSDLDLASVESVHSRSGTRSPTSASATSAEEEEAALTLMEMCMKPRSFQNLIARPGVTIGHLVLDMRRMTP